jgi:hypothetical protein
LPALFCVGYFWDRWTIYWFGTAILQISASWVARITGVSHRHLAAGNLLIFFPKTICGSQHFVEPLSQEEYKPGLTKIICPPGGRQVKQMMEANGVSNREWWELGEMVVYALLELNIHMQI